MMSNLLTYIIQVNLLLAIIYLGYILLLKKITFYQLNRFYFIIASVYALIYPFLDIKSWFSNPVKDVMTIDLIDWASIVQKSPDLKMFSVADLMYYIIGAGVLFLITKFFIQLLSLFRIHYYSKPSLWQNYLFRNVLFPIVPFSFINKIYVHKEQHREVELNDIFEHENIHVKGRHTFDILLFEIILIGCWYNPFVWFMRKAVRQNLEYLTDQQVLNKGVDRQSYQYSLLHVTKNGVAVGMGNQFNFKTLKKRIMMMNKKRSSKLELSKYACLLPIILLAGASFTVSKAESKIEVFVEKVNETPLVVEAINNSLLHDNTELATNVSQSDTAKVVLNDNENSQTLQDTSKKRIVIPGLNVNNPDFKMPLIIIDGEQKDLGFDVNTLSSNAIHSVNVIRGASAVSIYGDKAKNGAVIITSKDKAQTHSLNVDTVAGKKMAFVKTDSKPLIVVDGVEVGYDRERLEIISPDDIESMSILKDKSAIDKYGDKAKDGAIVITTKSNVTSSNQVTVRGKKAEFSTRDNVDYVIDNVNIVGYSDKASQNTSPKPDGGLTNFRKWVMGNYQFPKEALEAGVEGVVQVTFSVDIDGSLSDIRVIRDLGYGTGQAAINVFKKAAKWTPGTVNGKPAKITMSMPITLGLSK